MSESDEIRLSDEREGIITEQRLAFRRQVDIIQNLDDKALRTVRISFLLVGAIVSFGGFTAQTEVSVAFGTILYGTCGVVFLLSSIFLGMVTFDTTSYKTRLSDEEYMDLVSPDPPEGDHKVALRKLYRGWTKDAKTAVDRNKKLFAQMQTSFFLSIILISSAGGWMLLTDLFQEVPDEYLVETKVMAFPLLPVIVLVLVALGARTAGVLPGFTTTG